MIVGRVRRVGKNKALAHSANVIVELFQVVSWWWWCEGNVGCREMKLWLRGVMVVFGAAVEIYYGCGSVAASTRVFVVENETIVEEIAFIFVTGVAGSKCDTWGVLRREGGVAVDGGDRHGDAAAGSDSYGGSRRLEYRGRSKAGNF